MKRALISLGSAVVIVVVLIASLYRPELDPSVLEQEFVDSASRFAELAEMRVHFKDEGDGPPLLLIHGTASSLHTWDGWAAELAERFRLVRLDLPGFGLTGPDPTGDYSHARRVEVIVALLDYLRIERTAVAGSSLGGGIALELARTHPERVDALVLVDSAGYPVPRREGFIVFDLARLPIAGQLLSRLTPRVLVRSGVRQSYGDESKVTPELVDRYYRLLRRRGNRRALIAGLLTENHLDRDAIRSLEQPVLVMWGREDRLIAVETASDFDTDLADSDLVVYDGVGHVPMEEIPERSAEDTAQFLLSLESRQEARELELDDVQ